MALNMLRAEPTKISVPMKQKRYMMKPIFLELPYFGWAFELTVFFVVWGLPALAFLLLVFMVFKYGSRLGKMSLAAFICLVAVVLYRVFSN